jgi:hypothetical protein
MPRVRRQALPHRQDRNPRAQAHRRVPRRAARKGSQPARTSTSRHSARDRRGLHPLHRPKARPLDQPHTPSAQADAPRRVRSGSSLGESAQLCAKCSQNGRDHTRGPRNSSSGSRSASQGSSSNIAANPPRNIHSRRCTSSTSSRARATTEPPMPDLCWRAPLSQSHLLQQRMPTSRIPPAVKRVSGRTILKGWFGIDGVGKGCAICRIPEPRHQRLAAACSP